jgi:hypothetical protein
MRPRVSASKKLRRALSDIRELRARIEDLEHFAVSVSRLDEIVVFLPQDIIDRVDADNERIRKIIQESCKDA